MSWLSEQVEKGGDALQGYWDDLTGKSGAEAASTASAQQMEAILKGMEELGISYEQGREFLSGIYDEQKGGFDPFIEMGLEAGGGFQQSMGGMGDVMARLQAGPGEFKESAGYQFRRDQGLTALERQAGTSRSPYGSAAGKSMMGFASDLASQEYGKFYDRWLGTQGMQLGGYSNMASQYGGVMDMGAQSQAGKAGFASNIGNAMAGMYGAEGSTMADLWGQYGSAQAAGTMGESNQRQQGTQNMLTLAMLAPQYLSDERYKEDIHQLDGDEALKTVMALRPVDWAWRPDLGGEGRSAGVIAQQLREELPHLVHESPDGTLTVDYPGITGYLLAAVQGLNERIAEMEAKEVQNGH